ncbi:hypothetical protein ACNS7O_01315 [Haloferacaceae archaeon DSL9]
MGLDELNADIEAAYGEFDDEVTVDLDRETKNELAMLSAAFGGDDPAELVRRSIHLLYRQTVDSGDLDFHLRTAYDLTYDEYLAGVTYDDMAGSDTLPSLDENNRYRL